MTPVITPHPDWFSFAERSVSLGSVRTAGHGNMAPWQHSILRTPGQRKELQIEQLRTIMDLFLFSKSLKRPWCKVTVQRWITSTTKQAIRLTLAITAGHFVRDFDIENIYMAWPTFFYILNSVLVLSEIKPPKGGRDFWYTPRPSSLSWISGLSVWFHFSMSPLMFFCLVLLLILSCPFFFFLLILLTSFSRNLHFFKGRLFCMAVVFGFFWGAIKRWVL